MNRNRNGNTNLNLNVNLNVPTKIFKTARKNPTR